MKSYSQILFERLIILLYLFVNIKFPTHLINESSKHSWLTIKLMAFIYVFFNQKRKIKIVEYVAFSKLFIVFDNSIYISKT